MQCFHPPWSDHESETRPVERLSPHPEIQSKQPPFPYTVHQECGCLHLTLAVHSRPDAKPRHAREQEPYGLSRNGAGWSWPLCRAAACSDSGRDGRVWNGRSYGQHALSPRAGAAVGVAFTRCFTPSRSVSVLCASPLSFCCARVLRLLSFSSSPAPLFSFAVALLSFVLVHFLSSLSFLLPPSLLPLHLSPSS
eukprot:386374-Rhodomonas_salina.4